MHQPEHSDAATACLVWPRGTKHELIDQRRAEALAVHALAIGGVMAALLTLLPAILAWPTFVCPAGARRGLRPLSPMHGPVRRCHRDLAHQHVRPDSSWHRQHVRARRRHDRRVHAEHSALGRADRWLIRASGARGLRAGRSTSHDVCRCWHDWERTCWRAVHRVSTARSGLRLRRATLIELTANGHAAHVRARCQSKIFLLRLMDSLVRVPVALISPADLSGTKARHHSPNLT